MQGRKQSVGKAVSVIFSVVNSLTQHPQQNNIMSDKQGFKCSVLDSWQLMKWIKYIIVEILPPLK